MGYAFCMGQCYGCGRTFTFNPVRVPSVRDQSGTKQPLCRGCVDYVNSEKAKAGLPLFPMPEDAYEACDEVEL